MEIKKTAKADLENKKGLFLEIGLCASMVLMLLLFGWSQKEKVVVQMVENSQIIEEEIVEITRQDTPPPPPVARTITVTADIINIVKDDARITSEFDFTDFTDDLTIEVKKAEVQEEAVAEEEIFLSAEEMPSFQGGDLMAFRSWVQSRLKYPVVAMENGIQGRVMITFVVGKDGKVSRIQVLSAPDRTLGEEAQRVIESSPAWTPGKQRGNPVQIRYNLPVEFQIQN